MIIKSDKWITRQCKKPNYVYKDKTGAHYLLDINNQIELDEYLKAQKKSIKNGTIELLVATHNELAAAGFSGPMIEPFYDSQESGETHPCTWEQFKELYFRFGPGPLNRRLTPEERCKQSYDAYLANFKPNPCISYGLSSNGYDVRCANEFKLFSNIKSAAANPKIFDENNSPSINVDVCIIPPNGFALARTVEYFRIPRNISAICLGKDTYARHGIIVNAKPLEPGWEGHVTLGISNTTNMPAKIYANEGVAQMIFLESDENCEASCGGL